MERRKVTECFIPWSDVMEREKVTECFSPWIELVENAIKLDENCPNDFEVNFTGGNQLLNLWFSSQKFLVVYITSSGEIVYEQYLLEDLENWLNK